MSDIICKCGHGISYHDDTDGLGCLADVTPSAENRWRAVCPCEITCADIESANRDALSAELQDARAEIERLRGALEPFGRPENGWLADLPDDKEIVCLNHGTIMLGLTLGNLRIARAALKGAK